MAVKDEHIDGRKVRRIQVGIPDADAVWTYECVDEEEVLAHALEGGSDPYAAVVWPSARAAAAELGGRVRAGERVLELGAGSALCALAAARLGARALALDHDSAALARAARAAALQGLALETRVFDLAGAEPLPPAQLGIMADVLYEPALARACARRAAELLRAGARVLVADPGRFARDDFLRALAQEGWQARFQPREVTIPGEATTIAVGVLWLP